MATITAATRRRTIADLFRDNVRPTVTIDTQMDGLTVVLTCSATVIAGPSQPYEAGHLRCKRRSI